MGKTQKRRGPPKGKGGRPPLPEGERLIDVGVRLQKPVIDQIDEIAGPKYRSETIRDLLGEALMARAKKAGR